MEEQSENITMATSSSRRPSFVILCQQERRRSSCAPAIIPITVKAPKTSGGCPPKMLSLCQTLDPIAALAAGESGPINTEHDNSAIVSESEGVSGEAVALRELISAQREDLKTAALIGQRLLDSNDELSAKLEVAREEKWMVECEKEALRRDLENAMQRCEQMQRDTRSEIVPATEIEEFDLWSPANAVSGAGRGSASERGWASSTTAFTGAANDTNREREQHQIDEEVDRLKKGIKNLEQANNALKEELVEARLETTALRHTSVEHGEDVLNRETREFADEDTRGLCSGRSALDVREKLWVSAIGEESVCQGDGEEESIRSPAMVSGGTDTRETAAPVVSEALNGDSQKEQVDQEGVENLNAIVSHRTNDNFDGVEKTGETPEIAMPPENMIRRLSSSAFKDAEEQRELIEALRDQISQLQLEKQMRIAHTAKAENARGAKSAPGPYGGGGKLSGCSKCSSDDDSGSGRDDGEGDPLGEYQHVEDGAFSEEDASRRRRNSGDDVDSSGGNIDPAQQSFLQVRVGELLAELEAANKEIEILREQMQQQNQAERLNLRICELSAELEAASKANEALREQPPQQQAESLELRTFKLSAELEAANKETEALREQAHQTEGLELRVRELSGELENTNKVIEALHEQAQQNSAQGLQLRVRELSAELEAANKEIEAVREQAHQNQAERLELQRILLRVQGTRDRNNLIAAAVTAHNTCHDDDSESLEQSGTCLTFNTLGWLRRLWTTVFRRRRAEDGVGSRIEDYVQDNTLMEFGGALGDENDRRGSYRNGRGDRDSVGDREYLLNR